MTDVSLHEIVARVLDMHATEIHDDIGPHTVAAWTSLKHVQLVAAVEDAYGIKLTPREIRTVRTVSALRELVSSRAGGASGSVAGP